MGIDGVNSRIADIQSRIIAMQTQQAQSTTKATSTTPAADSTTFADYMSDAVAASSSTSGQTNTLNSKGIPIDLAAYGNGRVPATALEKIGNTGHRLWAPAAEALTRMMGEAQKAGVHIGVTDSYRSYAEQVDLAKRKGLYSQGGLAAKPGTSEHGWGMAADLNLDAKASSWMKQHGAEYGFVNNVPRESWHWAYKPTAT